MASKVTGIGFLAGENQPSVLVQKVFPLFGDDLTDEFFEFLNAHLSNRLHVPSPAIYFAAQSKGL